MPGNRILSAPRHRILFHPALHPESARRDSVLGLVLDQRRRESGARLHRPADRPYVDHAVHRRQRVTAASQLRQSDRRLDVRLPCLRVRGAGGVRDGQRVCTAQICAAEAAARSAAGAASYVDVDDDHRDDGSTATCRVDEGSTAGH